MLTPVLTVGCNTICILLTMRALDCDVQLSYGLYHET